MELNNKVENFYNKYRSNIILASHTQRSLESILRDLFQEMYELGYADGRKPTDEDIKSCIAMCLTDANEQRFKDNDWVVCEITGLVYQIKNCIENPNNHKYWYLTNDGYISSSEVNHYHLWTIKDAEDGDVLVSLDSKQPFIFKHRKSNEQAKVYCGINIYGKFFVGNTKDCIITTDKYIPATKEQRDLLFSKMKEAGYEWDAEKKEPKKIDNEEVNGEDYGIDGLYHAQSILERTLGKVVGYQSDDGILEHKCAITAVKKLYEQKSAEWSEEDEKRIKNILSVLDVQVCWTAGKKENPYQNEIDWLNSLKDRIN